jgi:aryl carrier-like protein
VADVAVVVHTGRLVAYLVPADGFDRAALTAYLTGLLPDYMVPSAFVCLDALPLTRNGKVDRRALPSPGPVAEVGYVAPRGDVERALAGIWADVLGRPRVGVHDNYFDLGGDSILAIQIVSRLRTVFGGELSPRAVFTAPTIAQLAELVRPSKEDVIPVHDGPAPLSFAQQRLWFLAQLEPSSAEYVVPVALRLRGTVDVDALRSALDGLVARHESLRTTFSDVDGVGVQVVHPPAEVPLPVVASAEDGLTGALARDLRPFDLRTGPLLRARLVRLGPEEHVLSLVLHHIITDGWSDGLLLAELAARYGAAVRDEPLELPDVPVRYADFAAWQRLRPSGDLEFWRAQLADVPALELPLDRPRPPRRSTTGATVDRVLSTQDTAGLRSLGTRHDATLFMTLVAACQVLFSRWSGQDDIALGTVTAGRDRADLDQVVGFFVNTLVLRSPVRPDEPVSVLLRTVRRTVLDAFDHQDVPFERIVDDLQPERDPSRTPLFQAMVVLQKRPGLRCRPCRGWR